MRVLFVVPYNFIPPNSGNKNLTYNLLKYIATNVECGLAILTNRLDSKEDIEAQMRLEYPTLGNVQVFHKPSGIALFGLRLSMLARGYHPSIARYINTKLCAALGVCAIHQEYDVVHFDMIHTASYRSYCADIPTILVASDAYSMAARTALELSHRIRDRMRLRFEGWLIKRFEEMEYHKFSIVCTVSDKDTQYLERNSPSGRFKTIGIGIAAEYTQKTIQHLNDMTSRCRILCTGSLDHEVVADGIITFLKRDLPRIKETVPELEVVVLGKNPLERLKRSIATIHGVRHIEYVDDYPAFLDQDWVYIYPQKVGSGLQTKLQQAMALGLPIVAFEISYGGLGIENGKHCFVCKEDIDMARHATNLLVDINLRRNIGRNAAEHVRTRFSISNMGNQMMEIYRDIIAKPSVD